MGAYLRAESPYPDEHAVIDGNKRKRRGAPDDTGGSDGEYVSDRPHGRQLRISRRGSAQAPVSPSGSDDSSDSNQFVHAVRCVDVRAEVVIDWAGEDKDVGVRLCAVVAAASSSNSGIFRGMLLPTSAMGYLLLM